MNDMVGAMDYKDFKQQETVGMRRRYDTYCAGPHGLVGKVVVTVANVFGGVGNMFHVDSVDHRGIHLKNGIITYTCPVDYYWRLIVLYD